jgi:hypothetical protein
MQEEKANAIAAPIVNRDMRARLKGLAHSEIQKTGLDVSSFFGLIFVIAINQDVSSL